mgnify:CR=1 FL=1
MTGGYPVYGKESQRWCPVEINIVIDGTFTYKNERYDNTPRTQWSLKDVMIKIRLP